MLILFGFLICTCIFLDDSTIMIMVSIGFIFFSLYAFIFCENVSILICIGLEVTITIIMLKMMMMVECHSAAATSVAGGRVLAVGEFVVGGFGNGPNKLIKSGSQYISPSLITNFFSDLPRSS